MRILQINVTANWGSHGKIAESIGQLALAEGWESMIAYGRGNPTSASQLLRIGNDLDMKIHGIATRLFDAHGLASKKVTSRFLADVEKYNPDIVHLHNIHGYYLNYPLLFDWLRSAGIPVVWTLHDCWPFTGHCAYYSYHQCYKWLDECENCIEQKSYPKSFYDGSQRNYRIKKASFTSLDNLTLVPVSDWLANDLKKSFLGGYPITVIHNGIDLDRFHPYTNADDIKAKYGIVGRHLLLGVASVWEGRKGLDDFIRLRKILPEDYCIMLVGLSQKQIDKLPEGIIGLRRTNSVEELAQLYSAADLFVNPTLEDNFPTTNLEALACGTPVVTYNTGGSPEAIDDKTGMVVDCGDVEHLAAAIQNICVNMPFSLQQCRDRAQKCFNQRDTFRNYIELYKSILSS